MTKNITTKALLASLILATLSACDADRGDASRPESGYATGTVVDTLGNPIAGAKILLDNTVFYASHVSGSTADDGTYRLKVHPGGMARLRVLPEGVQRPDLLVRTASGQRRFV